MKSLLAVFRRNSILKQINLWLLIGFLLLISQNISAQARKLLVFKGGVAVASGSIKGNETKVYHFKVKRNTDIEITLDDINSKPKFTLFKPNSKPFYEEGSVNSGSATDLMDILPDAGTYKIVVKLDDNTETKPKRFTLRLILK